MSKIRGGSPAFYFTDPAVGGMSATQQTYIIDLIHSLQARFPRLQINAVWDFGREEGDPVQGEKYGIFAESKDNAVYNAQLWSISYNHVRASAMPCETPREAVQAILAEYRQVEALSLRARQLEQEMMQQGVPFPQIQPRIHDELAKTCPPHLLVPGRENLLPLTAPLFAQVRAIRQLEDLQTIERLTLHEVGHLLSEQGGAVKTKPIRKLFATCRDGFEDIYEFCAECFMAGMLLEKIGAESELSLVDEVRKGV